MAWAWTSSPKGTRNISSPTMPGRSGEVAPEVTNGILAVWNKGGGGQREGGVALADAGHQAADRDRALGGGRGLAGVVLGVDGGDDDLAPAEQPRRRR